MSIALRARECRPGASPYICDIAGGAVESNGLECTASTSDLTVDVLDYNLVITNALATNTFQGKQAMLQSGFSTLGQAHWITYGTFIVRTIETLEANLRYRFTLRDMGLLTEQTVWNYGDDGFPTSSSSPRTIIGDPISIVTEILETECGYASGNLNLAAMAAYQAGLFNGCTMKFSITQPPQAKAWMDQEIYSPLAGFGFWNSQGQYTPHFLLPQGVPTVAAYPAFTPQSILDPIPNPRPAPYCAGLLLMMDYDGQSYNTQVLSTYDPSIVEFQGIVDITNRQSQGLRSASGGTLYARLAASATFRRYGGMPWLLAFKSPWPAVLLEQGDVVPVTHPQIPAQGSGMGITGRWYEVQKKAPNWKEGTVDLELIDVNWMNATQRVIAPNGTPNFAGSSPTQQAEYLYPDQGQALY